MSTIGALITSFCAAFLGSLLPGMLNMTAVSYALQRGQRPAQRFVWGATLPFFVHASVALFFAGVLKRNPQIFIWLRQFSVFLFLLLAVGFLYAALNPPRHVAKTRRRWRGGTPFQIGLLLSSLNALAIPYFLFVAGFAVAHGWMTLYLLDISAFTIGVLLGSFSIFQCYLMFANYIRSRARFFIRNVNFILSGLFLLLAIWQGAVLYLG
jgi:threonine/homoserine/homoserine lactone efflux protein